VRLEAGTDYMLTENALGWSVFQKGVVRCKAEFAAAHPTLVALGGCASVRPEAGNGRRPSEDAPTCLDAF
jgi:hypothetical protein